jgi:CTP:molybdopterin cytidylyltransferase MocA
VPGLSGDEGARRLLGRAPEIECGDLAPGRDVDTAADLEEVRRAAAAVV